MARQLQRTDGERDGKPLPFKLVPDVGAHSVVDVVESGVITHVKLDLVNDGGLAEIDQEDFHWRMSQDSVGARSRAGQHVLYQIGRHPILEPDTDTHSVDFSRIMEIDDRLFNDLVVWNVEIDGVVRAQPGRGPVNLHHFSETLAELQPVAQARGPVNWKRHAGHDPAEKILTGKTENDRGPPGAGQQPGQPTLG